MSRDYVNIRLYVNVLGLCQYLETMSILRVYMSMSRGYANTYRLYQCLGVMTMSGDYVNVTVYVNV